jgi:hypothetical protein
MDPSTSAEVSRPAPVGPVGPVPPVPEAPVEPVRLLPAYPAVKTAVFSNVIPPVSNDAIIFALIVLLS